MEPLKVPLSIADALPAVGRRRGRKRMGDRARRELYEGFRKWGWDEKGWSQRTRRYYHYRVLQADRWFEGPKRCLTWATVKELQTYVWDTHPSPWNRNQIRQALVGFFEYLMAAGLREDNPALGLHRLPEPKRLPKALPEKAVRKIVRASEGLGRRHQSLIALFAYTGLRRSEVRLLRWTEVDDDCSWLRLKTKGDKERAVPVHPELRKVLCAWRAGRTDPEWVFPSTRHPGRPMSDSMLQRMVDEVEEASGVVGFHPHLLRHSFGTALCRRKVNLAAVRDAMGHSDIRTTSLYLRVEPDEIREAVGKLDWQNEKPSPEGGQSGSGG